MITFNDDGDNDDDLDFLFVNKSLASSPVLR